VRNGTNRYHIQTNHFNIGALMQTGVHLMGNGQAPVHKYWNHLMDLIKTNEINPLVMVTHRFRLEDMAKVYEMFDKREGGIQKVFVQTKHSAPAAQGAPTLTEL
jgi:threonine dehydrogenase-like Zn-dependent dehydrogenase